VVSRRFLGFARLSLNSVKTPHNQEIAGAAAGFGIEVRPGSG
jgi:hypothetical protein